LLPSFAKLNNNELYLVEAKIGEGNAQGLHDFLKINAPSLQYQKRRTRRLTDKQVRKLVIDDTSITDNNLALILKGVYI